MASISYYQNKLNQNKKAVKTSYANGRASLYKAETTARSQYSQALDDVNRQAGQAAAQARTAIERDALARGMAWSSQPVSSREAAESAIAAERGKAQSELAGQLSKAVGEIDAQRKSLDSQYQSALKQLAAAQRQIDAARRQQEAARRAQERLQRSLAAARKPIAEIPQEEYDKFRAYKSGNMDLTVRTAYEAELRRKYGGIIPDDLIFKRTTAPFAPQIRAAQQLYEAAKNSSNASLLTLTEMERSLGGNVKAVAATPAKTRSYSNLGDKNYELAFMNWAQKNFNIDTAQTGTGAKGAPTADQYWNLRGQFDYLSRTGGKQGAGTPIAGADYDPYLADGVENAARQAFVTANKRAPTAADEPALNALRSAEQARLAAQEEAAAQAANATQTGQTPQGKLPPTYWKNYLAQYGTLPGLGSEVREKTTPRMMPTDPAGRQAALADVARERNAQEAAKRPGYVRPDLSDPTKLKPEDYVSAWEAGDWDTTKAYADAVHSGKLPPISYSKEQQERMLQAGIKDPYTGRLAAGASGFLDALSFGLIEGGAKMEQRTGVPEPPPGKPDTSYTAIWNVINQLKERYPVVYGVGQAAGYLAPGIGIDGVAAHLLGGLAREAAGKALAGVGAEVTERLVPAMTQGLLGAAGATIQIAADNAVRGRSAQETLKNVLIGAAIGGGAGAASPFVSSGLRNLFGLPAGRAAADAVAGGLPEAMGRGAVPDQGLDGLAGTAAAPPQAGGGRLIREGAAPPAPEGVVPPQFTPLELNANIQKFTGRNADTLTAALEKAGKAVEGGDLVLARVVDGRVVGVRPYAGGIPSGEGGWSAVFRANAVGHDGKNIVYTRVPGKDLPLAQPPVQAGKAAGEGEAIINTNKPPYFEPAAEDTIESHAKDIRTKNPKVDLSDDVNTWWITIKKYTNPPYTPGKKVMEFELEENQTFARVYDNINSFQKGGWLMKKEDILGLTAEQIRDKYALPSIPKFITDVEIPAGTRLRIGEANKIPGWGNGGGTQIDMIGQRNIGECFINPRPLKYEWR